MPGFWYTFNLLTIVGKVLIQRTVVFCYIVCINIKTFLVVSPRFWVVCALERLPTWKFDL